MSVDPPPFDGADREKVLRSFRRSLKGYRRNAVVQGAIAATLVDRFLAVSASRRFSRVFEFGSGTGFLTRELACRLTVGTLFVNDLVADSESHLAPLLDPPPCVWHFLPGPVETVRLPQRLDLVASSSAIQWIADAAGLLRRLADALAPGGWLVLSGFGRGHFQELQALNSGTGAAHYTDRDEWPGLLPDDMAIELLHQTREILHFPSARALLFHLRETGVNGKAGAVWSRGRLAAFEAAYEARFSDENGVRLTYEPVYMIARKRNG